MRRTSLFLVTIGLALVVAACASVPETTSFTTIALDKPVYFSQSDGADGLAIVDSYRVEAAEGSQVRLVPIGERPPLVVEATTMNYGHELSSPVALSVPGDEDAHHIVLLLPGGSGRDAAGSLSGVRTRGNIPAPLAPARVQALITQLPQARSLRK